MSAPEKDANELARIAKSQGRNAARNAGRAVKKAAEPTLENVAEEVAETAQKIENTVEVAAKQITKSRLEGAAAVAVTLAAGAFAYLKLNEAKVLRSALAKRPID